MSLVTSAFENHKHMFRVAESAGFRSTKIFFKCETCLANVWIDRWAWYRIVVEGNKYLTEVDELFPMEWRVCHDQAWHPNIPPEIRPTFAGW